MGLDWKNQFFRFMNNYIAFDSGKKEIYLKQSLQRLVIIHWKDFKDFIFKLIINKKIEFLSSTKMLYDIALIYLTMVKRSVKVNP